MHCFFSRLRHVFTLCLAAAALMPCAARAAERVLLRNGFSIDCSRREHISPGRIRLYLNEATDNYMEVETASVASVAPLLTTPPLAGPASKSAATAQATAGPKPLGEMIAAAGAEHRIQSALLASVVQAESAGRAHAVSRAGAQGLMQLMPGTAKELGVRDSFAPEENLRGGTAYLDRLLVRYHDDLPLALAAYNAGPAVVDRYHGVPPYRETQMYVARIIREFNRRVLLERAGAQSSRTIAAAALASTGSQ